MIATAVDIFCGMGGLSYGLKKAGISIAAGVDVDKYCQYSYEKNVQADFILRDVSNIHGQEIIEKYWSDKNIIKILAGCAPCQPFSTHSNKIKDRFQTKKWWLLREFERLIDETNPHIVTMENVPNLANQKIFQDFVSFLEQNEYHVTFSNVFCPDYGIPQKRRRLVLLASKFGEISILPKTHLKNEYVTLRQAIGHLPPVEAGEINKDDPFHRTSKLTPLNLRRIEASKPNGTWQDWNEDLQLECHKKQTGRTYKAVYGRMAWDEPSPTITTQFYSYGTGRFGHPTQNRALTMREAALLQTFPAEFEFYANEKDIFLKRISIYIGNAVPVKLAIIIGESILNHLGVYDGHK
jgi:DNA (cytosine-5)-methyltransferase 1